MTAAAAGVPMSSAATALFGRGRELRCVTDLLDASTLGFAGLLLDGEPGVGKTAVWQAGVDEATRRAVRVLVARPARRPIGPIESPSVAAKAGLRAAACPTGCHPGSDSPTVLRDARHEAT